MSKETPKVKSGICICYIGLMYHHDDKSGGGYCVDMFVPDGRLKQCKAILDEKRCPYGRSSPYEDPDEPPVPIPQQVQQ